MKLLFVAYHNICLVVLVFMLLNVAESLRMSPDNDFSDISFQEQSSPSENRDLYSKEGEEELGMELYPTGSTLPDCSHACGPCFPCKRVMVSFKCSLSESCPIVYRCMCKGKYYHVPSN